MWKISFWFVSEFRFFRQDENILIKFVSGKCRESSAIYVVQEERKISLNFNPVLIRYRMNVCWMVFHLQVKCISCSMASSEQKRTLENISINFPCRSRARLKQSKSRIEREFICMLIYLLPYFIYLVL